MESVIKTKKYPDLTQWWRILIPLALLAAGALFFHYWSGENFLTSRNLSNLSRQVCVQLTLAVGMTLVILTAGIDLSIGSALALASMVIALTQVRLGWAQMGIGGAGLSVLCGMAAGCAVGFTNGILVSRYKIVPFIVTLGMMVVCRGLTLVISSAQAVAPIGPTLGALSTDYLSPQLSFFLISMFVLVTLITQVLSVARQGDLGRAIRVAVVTFIGGGSAIYVFCGYRGIPFMVFVSLFCLLGAGFILHQTRFGRFVYAIGSNRDAAILAGVPVARTLLTVYVLMGLLTAVAATMDVTRVNGAVPSAGELSELDAVAAVVIGGTSLMGGAGSVWGTSVGVLLLGILNNGMSLIGLSEHYQKLLKGLVIILAVYLDRSRKK